MIDAGLNVVASLVILEQQTDDKALAAVIREVRSDVEGGMLLSQAMARHPNAFDRLYISMIEAGEAAGILDTVLDRVAVQIEKEMKIRRRVKGAMIYPIVVLVVRDPHPHRDAPLPRPGLPEDLRRPRRRPSDADEGRRRRLRPRARLLVHPLPGDGPLRLGLPALEEDARRAARCGIASSCACPAGIGKVVLKVTMARFSRTLATLVAAGVDIIKALEISGHDRRATGSSSPRSPTCARRCTRAFPSPQPLIENPVFPPLVSQMVKVGEETGELEKMLDKIADFYEDEVDTSIASLTSIIEPLMMMGVGAIIGIIVIAMYLPMFKLLELVQ